MSIPDSLLDRFFDALVREIRKSRPGDLQSSFTVAEIYQNLVPYRTHRDIIGVEINGDYEDALLRLLAGEGEFLEMESQAARKRIQEELRSSNPNTTIYREFAAAEVRLHRARARILAAEEAGSTASRARDSGRVEVGWAAENAAPVEPTSPGEHWVDPDLGLFVADLFEGGTGSPPEEVPLQPAGIPVQPEALQPPVTDLAEAEPTAVPSSWSPGASPGEPDVAAAPSPGRETALPDSHAAPPAREEPSSGSSRDSRWGGSTPGTDLEEENRRLRRIVADQALEILRLRDLLDGS